LWMIRELQRWGYVGADLDAEALARRVYRPDLHALAARAEGLAVPTGTRKAEGGHDGPWSVAAEPAPIAMLDDRFCDGAVYPA
ncbi:hypothetical protein OEZ78_28845, partial [Leclercia adecarboxylata]|uniref:hypothetical protein n=1 Tax=Leclercia adecarboxylata TaxID=83655 RepID=UPI00234C6D2E